MYGWIFNTNTFHLDHSSSNRFVRFPWPLTGKLPPATFSSVDAFEVVQGEFGDMMARLRLKSIWRFQSWGIIGEDLPQNVRT